MDDVFRSEPSTCSHIKNSGVVTSAKDANGVSADYYGILQKILSIRSRVQRAEGRVFLM
jgi:hypothetical protein